MSLAYKLLDKIPLRSPGNEPTVRRTPGHWAQSGRPAAPVMSTEHGIRRRRVGGTARVRDLAFRRSPHVVTFWQRGEHLIFNYATGVVVRGSSLAIEVLDGLGRWKTWATLSRNRSREEQRLLRRLVDLMVRRTFVTRSDEPRDVDEQLSALADVESRSRILSLRDQGRQLSTPRSGDVRRHQERRPHRAGRPRRSRRNTPAECGCRRADWPASFPRCCSARRTWREFGRGPIAVDGPRHAAPVDLGRARLDRSSRRWTACAQDLAVGRSPAQHRGLRPRAQGRGPRAGSVSLSSRCSPARTRSAGAGPARDPDYIPGQHWYKDAGAVFLMTTVFDRVQWRYPSRPRVSRHPRRVRPPLPDVLPRRDLARTSRLSAPWGSPTAASNATWKSMASPSPSSTPPASGLARRASTWAPWPGTDQTPVLTPPAHAGRKARSRRSSPTPSRQVECTWLDWERERHEATHRRARHHGCSGGACRGF